LINTKTTNKTTGMKNEPLFKKRYREIHLEWFKNKFPKAYKDHGVPIIEIPNTKTSNGLQKYIIKFITYHGYRATRVNVQGRLIDKSERQESGITLSVKKWTSSTTRRGTADVSATIKGRSVMLEVKIGNDKPSKYQLEEQQRERMAGGIYEFIKTPEDFLQLFDKIINL
jgi:hypothetical protein